MKFRTMLAAAGLVIASLGVSAAADAQPRGDRWEQNDRRPGYDRRDRARDDRRSRYRDDRRRYERRARYRGHSRRNNKCTTYHEAGRQWQVCR